jgi:hypothetical protein
LAVEIENACIVLDAIETPDFNMRTNGFLALKAMIRILEGDTLKRLYYPDEGPISIGDKLVCPG